jgi:hypothetical protein
MPTLEATLLPPVASDDRAADRHLEEVGVGAALDAMREQKIRRSSFPAAAEVEGDIDALLDPDATNEIPRPRRAPQNSDAFLKAR